MIDPYDAWEPWPTPDVVQGQGIVSVVVDESKLDEMPPRSRPAGFTR